MHGSNSDLIGTEIIQLLKFNSLASVAACAPATIPAGDAQFINQRINEGYSHNWQVDGLPAAEYQEESSFYTPGFDLVGTGIQIICMTFVTLCTFFSFIF